MSIASRTGFMAGFLSTLYLTVIYIYDKHMLIQGYERLTLVIFIIAIFYVAFQATKSELQKVNMKDLVNDEKALLNENYASLSELLSRGFKTYLIGFLIKFFFVYFLFNYYDSELISMVKDAQIEIFKMHKPESETEMIFNARLKEFSEGDFGPSLMDVFGIAWELFIGFFISLIAAFILRRDKPDY